MKRYRSPGRKPVFDGDFDSDEPITEVLERADYDGRTYVFGGASAVGLDPADVYRPADTGAIALDYAALREEERRAQPQHPPVRHDDDTIARDMARGWERLFEVRCAYPAANHDTPIPCGAVHRDGTARTFRGLRTSAWAAGWHLDAFGRWACPDCCQASPEYRTIYAVTVWDGEAAGARLTGDGCRPDCELCGHGERLYRAEAEHDLFRSVRDARARHAGSPR